MKLLRTFPKVAFEFGLASWRWMGIREQTPRFATCFGDIFLESLDGWWFLDTVEGTLELRWTSAVTMYAELESPEGRATYLMDDLVRDARSRGIHLGEEDVYTFNPHPAVGGELGVNGLGTMRFELAVNWAGQVHDQVLHSSGEIRIPPMPDDGRRSTAPRVAAAWDAAWSDDETFDVPFEQYLATTTFAAVTAPAPNDSGYPSLPPSRSRERDDSGHVPYAAQSYGAHGYGAAAPGAPAQDALTGPAQPDPTTPWPGPDQSAAPWSGQTASAQHWPEPSQAPHDAAPPEGYDAPYDTYAAAPEQYGTDEQQPGEPYAQETWSQYGADHDAGAQVEPDPNGATWGNPAWGNTGWGGQTPAVAAGGSPQQNPSADPFTAWDDLWGKR
ncbi:hypothetical protein [Promicromonospora panici]|uniref:hypothetical protein n=1 Tax=Promicromonospora panici TaxID=2219658 RepID=UPI001A928559|nr:hypothetical protein [Promicromonospora panici]